MRRSRALVLFLVLFLVVVLVGSIVAIISMLDGGGADVEEGSILVLKIGGPLPEQPMPEQPLAGLGSTWPSVLEFDSALRKAAVDERVSGVLIRPLGLRTGFAKVQELHGAIERFKADSDKPVTCWMEAVGNKEYLLATACDEIYMAPEGFFLVNGMHLSVTFYKGTLDKVGVEAEFTRAGKYKSAIEPMTSEQMSEPFRQMMEELADSLYDDFVTAIAESRGLSDAEVRALIDDPPLTTAAAARAGLIDGLLYKDQLRAMLSGEEVEPIAPDSVTFAELLAQPAPPPREIVEAPAEGEEAADEDEDEVDLISMADYALVKPSSLGLGGGEKVAVLYAEGQIMSGESDPGGGLSARTMGSDTMTHAMRQIRKDDSIKAVVLRIDSPGGSGLASDVMWRELELLREAKPVVVSMSDYAASGGYYIAMGADAIVAQPGTLTGSIGVFAGKYNLGGLYDKIGLKTESIKRGEMADIFAANQPLGEDGANKLGEFVDEFYGAFISKAADGRRVAPAAIHDVAQGRVWTGEQALAVGLVDELGGFRTALDLAKEKAGLADEEVSLVLYPRQPTFLEQLLNQSSLGGALAPLLDGWNLGGALPSEQALTAAARMVRAAPLFADGTPVLMAPFDLQVW
ncbi:MAG: signal peptide peptidase SppA [Proteobacteria bacterium]|nr:signal peptide peptidase SppA [Pseudomonadota bacterium]